MNGDSGRYTSRLLNKLVIIWLLYISVVLLAVMTLYWFDRVASWSVLLGGLVFIIPNVYFTVCAFRHSARPVNSAIIVRNLYRGETGKFILSLTGFAAIFASAVSINGFVLFATYVALTLVHWVLVLRLEF